MRPFYMLVFYSHRNTPQHFSSVHRIVEYHLRDILENVRPYVGLLK